MTSKDHSSTQTPLINFIRTYSKFSRRDVLSAIRDGNVTVNKQCVTDATHLVSDHDTVCINGKTIQSSTYYYYKFYKPIGTLSTFKDPQNRPDLSWHLKKNALPESLKPCGRLDFDSSGLLLFSNDGHFINQILHPKHAIQKTYIIALNKPLSSNHQQQLSSGFFLADGPVSIIFDSKQSPTEFTVTISMGRNRILRRSFEHFGYTIRSLHRQSIGQISIGNLRPGEFQKINEDFIKILVQP